MTSRALINIITEVNDIAGTLIYSGISLLHQGESISGENFIKLKMLIASHDIISYKNDLANGYNISYLLVTDRFININTFTTTTLTDADTKRYPASADITTTLIFDLAGAKVRIVTQAGNTLVEYPFTHEGISNVIRYINRNPSNFA